MNLDLESEKSWLEILDELGTTEKGLRSFWDVVLHLETSAVLMSG